MTIYKLEKKIDMIIKKKKRDIKVNKLSINLFQSDIKTHYSYSYHLVERNKGFGWLNLSYSFYDSVK